MRLRFLNDFAAISLACAALAACGDDKNETMTEATSGATTSATGTDGVSSTPTSDGSGDGTSAGSGVDGTGSGGLDTGGPDTGGTDTGPAETTDAEESGGTGGGGFGQLCADFCARADECDAPLGPMCKKDCQDAFQGEDAACEDAAAAVFMCFAGLSCRDFALALEAEEEGVCGPAIVDQIEACGSEVCEVGGGGDMEGNECTWTVMCPEEPTLEMQCDTMTCVCLAGGDPVGECDAEGVCMDIGGLADKAEACCGF